MQGQATSELIEIQEAPEPAELEGFLAELAHSLAMSSGAYEGTASPFVIVTPVGLEAAAELWAAFERIGVRPTGPARELPWPRSSTLLRAHRMHEFGKRRAWYFERVWSLLYPGAIAEAWPLRAHEHALLQQHKAELRAATRARPLCVVTPSFSFRTRLHAFHLPDPEDLHLEARALAACTSLQ